MPIKHCGNCEYCNLDVGLGPCNKCEKQSHWKLAEYGEPKIIEKIKKSEVNK